MTSDTPPVAPPWAEPLRPRQGISIGCAVLIVLGGLIVSAYLGLIEQMRLKNDPSIFGKAVMKGLEIGVKGYRTEYLRLPHIGDAPPTKDNEPFDTTDPRGMALLDILLAKSPSPGNPQDIRFWEAPPRRDNGSGYTPETGLVDMWGQQGYRIILDYDQDGKILNPAAKYFDTQPEELFADVILYSAGKDGDFDTWKDNVTSWQ